MRTSPVVPGALAVGLVLAAGCDITEPPLPQGSPSTVTAAGQATPPAPAPLVTVAGMEFWPFTSATLSGAPSDPMNLVFPGVDARSVRAALVMLDGDRTAWGFPPGAPFDCTWKEAMAANQSSYATAEGWTGSAVQLECGDYMPVRFHIRMFPAGDGTVANAHFEVQIPGTNGHEVLSWELAQQLVTVDLARSGVLAAPPSLSAAITPVPSFRAINPLVYNGLPDALKTLAGGPAMALEPVPLVNDGAATILPFAGPVDGERTVARREFVLQFDQTIPKPFCVQGPLDYLHVVGPIDFRQQVVVSGSGNFITHFHAHGSLELTPVNPLTGEVTGEALRALVAEHDRGVVTDAVTLVSTFQIQLILPKNGPAGGRLQGTLRVGPGVSDRGGLAISCGS